MKIYVAKIEVEYEVDENNYLHWEDEYQTETGVMPRPETQLFSVLRNELWDTMIEGSNQIYNTITVEEKGRN